MKFIEYDGGKINFVLSWNLWYKTSCLTYAYNWGGAWG